MRKILAPPLIAAAMFTGAMIMPAAASTGTTMAAGHNREHACLAQMRVLREVSREAGITIGSAFLGPSRYPSRPRLWHRQLERAGLRAPAGAIAVKPFGIAANQAFVRAMTDAAARILNGRARCSGGLPLT